MLTFAHVWMFWLTPLPLAVRWVLPARALVRPAVRVPFLGRVQAAGGTGAGASPGRDESLAVATLVWLLVLVALARPQWLEPPIERSIPTRDLLLVVDLSGSMDQQDFTNASGQPVDRLSAVKEVLGDFLARREGDRVGLVVFGNAPFLQVPFTADLALCQQLLDETAIRMAGPRTALGDAIGLGIRLFETSDGPTKTIIALTDGNDNSSAVPPVEAARVAADRGITIHTVAMGDPTTVGEEALDEPALRAVAQATGGDFFLAMNRGELTDIYDRLDQIETREVKTVSHRPRRDLYFWPLAAALLAWLASHGWKLWAGRAAVPVAASAMRLRVNPQTFQLETTEQ
ncbi:MAG: VWA domain-containing protein [Pirellulaceae bacterium]|jgi:Ca-activated chloride channel family protein|nr:VWA domain-containing protein [Pirellulaceae bacterium]